MPIEFDKSSLPYQIICTPSFVVNVRGERYAAVHFAYNQLVANANGTFTLVDKSLFYEGERNRGVPYRIIKGPKVSIDGETIRHQLLYGHDNNGGVFIGNNGTVNTRLVDMLREKGHRIDVKDRSMEKSETLSEKPKLTLDEQKTVIEHEASIPSINQTIQDYTPLSKRIDALEQIAKIPAGKTSMDYQSLADRVSLLEKKYNSLGRPRHGYKETMRGYYTPLISSSDERLRLTGTIAKILAGDYKACSEDLANGKKENEKAKRIIKWEKRIEAVKTIYSLEKDKILKNVDMYKPIMEAIHNNRYLMKNHNQYVKELDNLFNYEPKGRPLK